MDRSKWCFRKLFLLVSQQQKKQEATSTLESIGGNGYEKVTLKIKQLWCESVTIEYEFIILWQIWGIYIFELKFKKRKTYESSSEKKVLPKIAMKVEAKYNSKNVKT